MSNNVLHTTVLLQALIAMLNNEGIEINTSAALNIEKVLINTDLEEYNTFSKLKFRIVPIISRNKEEQGILYKIFERLDDKFKKEELVIIQPINSSSTSIFPINGTRSGQKKWREISTSILFKISLAVLLLLAGAWIFLTSLPTLKAIPTAQFEVDKFDLVIGDTVTFKSKLSDLEKKSYKLSWQFPDTIIHHQWQVSKVLQSAGDFPIKTVLTDGSGNAIDSAEVPYTVMCEKTPSLSIQKLPEEYIGKRWPGKGAVYVGIVVNPSVDSANYKYTWLVNDVAAASEKDQRILVTQSKYNNDIKLIITWDKPETHCSTDSLGAQLSDQPAISAVITGDHGLQIVRTNDWRKIGLSVMVLLLLPLAVAYIIYKLLTKKPLPKKDETVEEETTDEGPYSINFKTQNDAIHTEHEIDKLADVLRKRQVSHVNKLNIRKTIYNTVRSGGLPQLAYTPVTKASDYLVFIEKGNPDSHLAKLFEYLLDKLKKDQVNLDVYEYRKEPLFLTNEKLNHSRIPVDKMAALYPDRTLFIFGDTRHFVLSLKGKLKDWVGKLSTWKTRIVVTPYSKNDWDKKEQLLTEANFIVIPADLTSEPIVEAVVNGQIDVPSQTRFVIETTYPARFLNFQDFESLRNYLANEDLLRWVCSLAVYSTTNWNLTLAIGKSIEKDLQQKGKPVELVNYSNLLKLARISWLDEGIIGDTIRIQMLEHIDNETEALARQTLVEQLGDLHDKILPGSLLKRQFDVEEKVNSFLVDTYNNKKPSKEDTAFVKDILEKNQLDQSLSIYLKNGKDTLLKHPTEKGKTVSIEKYFDAIDKAKKGIATAVASGVFFLLLLTGFFLLKSKSTLLQWKHVEPSLQTYILTHPGIDIKDLFLSTSVNDSVKATPMKPDTIQLRNLITDTSKLETFSILTVDSKLLSQDSIKFNSNIYTVLITRPSIIPLIIFYNNATDEALANLIRDNLPPNFTVTIRQKRITDTATSIFCFNDTLMKDAELAKTILSKLLNKDVLLSNKKEDYGKSADYVSPANQEAKSIVVYAVSPQTCTPVTVNAMPQILTEIWHSEAGSRLLNINLSSNVLYYSTGGKETYGTYRLSQVCLMKSGAYKIISKTDKGLSVFFLRNITPQSFELSICLQPNKTMTELESLTENDCGEYYKMTPYYDNVRSQIFLPVRKGNLPGSEQAKVKSIEAQMRELLKKYPAKYALRFFRNDKFLRSNNTPDQYLENIRQYQASTMPQLIPSPTPFQRSYFTISFQAIPSDAGKYVADCKRIFSSMEEAQKEQSPLIICRLDLSSTKLSSIPSQVYNFTNLKELDLGFNSIGVAEINRLKKALPKCNIKSQSSDRETKKEVMLGTIYLDDKNYPTPESLNLIQNIARQIANSYDRQVRLDTRYSDRTQIAEIESAVKVITDVFIKEGVKPSYNQITKNIQPSKSSKGPQKQMQNRISKTSISIRVIGINFPPPASAN